MTFAEYLNLKAKGETEMLYEMKNGMWINPNCIQVVNYINNPKDIDDGYKYLLYLVSGTSVLVSSEEFNDMKKILIQEGIMMPSK